ncbi:MAG: VIT and VWA domain-containing protein [Planctomycetota bacterium]
MRETHAKMSIREDVAEKRLRMKFHNTGSGANTEATFFMELEPDQRVESFSVTIDGKTAEGEILDAEKARKIYEGIVAKQKDPALLEYYGARLLRVRIFPVPANADFEVEIRTIEALRSQGGLVRVNTLNAVPASFRKPLKTMTVEATIESSKPLKAVFSPTHDIVAARTGPRAMKLTYSRQDYFPAGPFVFYYQASEEAFGAAVLAFEEPGEDGAFMITIAPPADGTAGERLPRDIVFALDTSGSMLQGDKIGQVRKALAAFVETLTDKDRFNIITFSTEARAWRESLVTATAEAKAAGVSAANSLNARGGAAIEDALKLALAQSFRPDATKIVVFLTDGTPTIGERDDEALLKIARGRGVRVFAFGAGFDLNTRLLDRLAIENGGDRQYIHPNENATEVLASFAKRIDAPLLADPVLKFAGVEGSAEVTDVQPKKLPDIFQGGSVVVTGRFKGKGARRIELSGTAGRETRSVSYTLDFASEPRNDFVPRLWAIQRIDFLLDEIRTRGASKELAEEIVRLSKRYGVVTPYTAGLITEDVPVTAAGIERRVGQSAGANYNGQQEWELGRNQQEWRGAYNQERQQLAANGALGRGNDANAQAELMNRQRNVGNRAFYNRGGAWQESGYEAQVARTLKFGTEEYFEFLRNNDGAGAVLALGRNITFRLGSEWIRVE